MNRSEYSDGLTNWSLIRYRGQVASAIRGARGQAFLRSLRDAMDAMPEKVLIRDELVFNGQHCALGVALASRGIDPDSIPDDHTTLAAKLNIAESLVREIQYENDEDFWGVPTPEGRWRRVRQWVEENIR